MGWVQAVVLGFQFILKIWDAIKERNDEIKKRKTEALQSGLRGLVDGDRARITAAFTDLNRMR